MAITDDLGPLSWTVSIVFFTISAISFILRVIARALVAKTFTWDDRFMTIAFVTLIGQQYICWQWLVLGGGKHAELVKNENLRKIRQYELVDQFYYLFVHFFLKLSYLAYFCRTLDTPRFSIAIRITVAVVFVQTIASWIFYAFQCRPLSAFIDPEDYPDATCYPYGIAYYAPAALNVAIIVLICALPIPTLTQHPREEPITTPSTTPPPPADNTSDPEQQQLPQPPSGASPRSSSSTSSTAALFILAGAGIIVSGLRVVVLYQQSTTDSLSSPSSTFSTDRTYTLALLTIATTVELSIHILTANLPSIRVLFLRSFRSASPSPGHELRDRRRRRKRGDSETDEDELWGEGEEGGKITITSRVSISITEALRGKDGPAGYPKIYYKFARPGAVSPTPNFLKDV